MIESKHASAKDDSKAESASDLKGFQQTGPPGVKKSKAAVWICGVLLALWTGWLVYLAFLVPRN